MLALLLICLATARVAPPPHAPLRHHPAPDALHAALPPLKGDDDSNATASSNSTGNATASSSASSSTQFNKIFSDYVTITVMAVVFVSLFVVSVVVAVVLVVKQRFRRAPETVLE